MRPILILGYSRLNEISAVVQSVLSQPHGEIYVSCDGPKGSSDKNVSSVQRYVECLHSEGKVQQIQLHSTNFGVLRGVQNGIDWFFENVDEGLILEDDVVLAESALANAEYLFDLLDKRKDVATITLRNFLPHHTVSDPSVPCRLSRLNSTYAWGTSASYWNQSTKSLTNWSSTVSFAELSKSFGFFGALGMTLDLNLDEKRMAKGQGGNWDNCFSIFLISKKLLTLCTNENFVEYVGFGSTATHTQSPPKGMSIHRLPAPNYKIPHFDIHDLKVDKMSDQYQVQQLKQYTAIKLLRKKISLRVRLKRFFRIPIETTI
jgi:hypothetical protein